MPSDIRSFFGGKVPPPEVKDRPTKTETKKKGRGRKQLDDSDEEEAAPPQKNATPKKVAPMKRERTPDDEATTTSAYFGNSKPKRTTTASKNPVAANPSPTKSPSKSPAIKRDLPRRTAKEEAVKVIKTDEDETGADDIFADEYRGRNGRDGRDDYEEGTDEEVVQPKPKRTPKKKQAKVKQDDDAFEPDGDIDMKDTAGDDDFVAPDAEEEIEAAKPARGRKAAASSARKRKSTAAKDDDEDGTPTPKKTKTVTKAAPKRKQAEPENAEMQAIFDSIPTVRPPTPPSEKKAFKFGQAHANSGAPPAAGAKDIPVGADNCLAGLSFVFTGLLETISREEGQSLVKRYGGKVMSGPSRNTSFVVLGSDAGPKKLQTIRDYNLRTINEDGLFELIRKLPANGGGSKAADKYAEKQREEETKAKEMAAEAEREERRVRGAGGAVTSSKTATNVKPKSGGPDGRLWTVKHAPSQMSQICGNKSQVEKLQRWLKMFPKNQRTGFKLAGPDGSGVYRAVMIHGPPGIGKTTAAHLVAKLEGYDIVESNASDTRSKKLVESGLKGVLSTTSLMGYFAGDGKQAEESKKKLVLIMDEVDGMSAGDRGGVGALAAVCKKTQIPMILICNDRRLPKMKPFDYVTYDLGFRRPTVDMIRSRIMTIAFREGLKLPAPVINALIEGTQADIRQVVNMISTIKLDQDSMDFDDSKQMSKAWQKHVVLKPWDILGKILGGGMFATTSKATLNEKQELYFNDHEMSYLMLQENYLGTTPMSVSSAAGKERTLKHLRLVEKAANSISEGDLADRLIHGQEQHWNLMPAHAILSFVRPASFVAGSMAGNASRFPSWLGKNSSMGKSVRQVKEIQGHMRLRCSADRHEIRQQYIPMLWEKTVHKLQEAGKDAVPEVIDLMDSYFLTKEDWEGISELGVGPMDLDKVSIDSQTKATFTRLYNQQSHPMPFMKASNVVAPKRSTKEQPDLEEAIEESDEGEVLEDPAVADDDEDVDLSKDKYVKQPKKKKAPAAKGKGKKAMAVEEDDDEGEDEKPKKGKAAAKAKGKSKK